MNVLSIILLAIGILIRAALYYSPTMFQIDPDAVVAGICAFRIEHGQYPLSRRRCLSARAVIFPPHTSICSDGRTGLALTGVTWECRIPFLHCSSCGHALDRNLAAYLLFAIVRPNNL